MSASRGSRRLHARAVELTQSVATFWPADPQRIHRLARRVLAETVGEDPALLGPSSLNNDGVPLQLCLTANRRGKGLKIIGDPGAHLEPEARYQEGWDTLRTLLNDQKAEGLLDLAHNTYQMVLPQTPKERSSYRDGFLWVGASPDSPGIAFYLETAPLGPDSGWSTAAEWLEFILPSTTLAHSILDELSSVGIVASLGLEGSTLRNARAKIYFRLRDAHSLHQLATPLFSRTEIQGFLQRAMGLHGVDRDGLVFSVGFHIKSGDLADVKIDLCGHCLPYSPKEWIRLVDDLCSEHSLVPVPVAEAFATESIDVAFISLGLDSSFEPRLNLYLKNRRPSGQPQESQVENAFEDGLAFLASRQTEDGYWTDYNAIPVGPSDQWVTAYTALALWNTPARAGESRPMIDQAAHWLLHQQGYPAGWGYNRRTGADGDSTGLTLALLRHLRQPIHPKNLRFLKEKWKDTAFTTYEGPGAWGDPHWDITPWSYFALDDQSREDLEEGFRRGLQDHQIEGGFWRSYWWRTPLYATFQTLEVIHLLGIEAPPPIPSEDSVEVLIDNAFDLACWIGIKIHREEFDASFHRGIARLLGWQRMDGSWPPSSILRVTDDQCHDPWIKAEGEVYADDAGIMTTATALRVLSLALCHLSSADSNNLDRGNAA